jgi:hypothetical protein
MGAAAAALPVMPSLAVAKHLIGKALASRALVADAAESAFAPSHPGPRSWAWGQCLAWLMVD